MSPDDCLQTIEKTSQVGKLNFSIVNWPANLSFKQQTSHSNNKPLIQTTNLSFTQRTSHSNNKPLIQTTNLSFKQQTSHSNNKPLIQTTNLSFKQQNMHPKNTPAFDRVALSKVKIGREIFTITYIAASDNHKSNYTSGLARMKGSIEANAPLKFQTL